MSNRTSIGLDFGDGTAHSFAASGATASSVVLRNVAWSSANSALSSTSPAQSWSYVLNNGTAASSIARELTAALQATGTAANPVTASYSADATGAITASAGAPALATHTDNAGNTVYAITLAKNAAGAAIRTASVVSINTASASSSPLVTAATATSLLSSALQSTGFTVSATGTGLVVTNPATTTPLSLSTGSFSNFAGLTTQPVSTHDRVVFLGAAAASLAAGQTLLSSGQVIGTIQSVSTAGAVTLTSNAATTVPSGGRVDVAIGAGISNIGLLVTSPADASTTSNTLALGDAASGLQPGQTITSGSNVIGIVKSIDKAGTVTFTANLAAPVAAGDTLGVLPHISTGNIAALSAGGNAATILSQYETNGFETKQGKQVPGLDAALYYTRTMPGIKTINQLMSDRTLLKVITTNLGLSSSFNNLDFDQQVRLLTAKVKLSDYTTPAKVQHQAEQYLVLTNAQAMATSANNAVSDLFGDNPNSSGNGNDLLSKIYPADSSGDNAGVASLFNDAASPDQPTSVSLSI